VLDTVLVVDRKLSTPTDRALKTPYQSLIEPTLRGANARPYLGKTYDPNALFSFAPCKPVADAQKAGLFERPSVKDLLHGLSLIRNGKTPSLATQVLTCCRPPKGDIEEFWRQLTALVWAQGLLLGTHFKLPKIKVLGRPSAPPPPPGCAANCLPPKRRSAA
jgi:hypothetical protein